MIETRLRFGPIERNVCVSDAPLCKLSLTHVWGKRLHDLAVGNLADEIIERLFVFPDGKRPEFAGERFCVEGIADDARRGFQLPLDLECKAEEAGNGAEVAEGKIGDEREILAARSRRRDANPGNFGHGGIVASESL